MARGSNNRGTKFYRKNEAEVMKRLGLRPTKNSGAGWVEKSDGQNDNVICELKSTDKLSYRLTIDDLHTLIYNADVTRKYPVFAIQFLQSDELFLLVRPGDIKDVAEYLETGEAHKPAQVIHIDTHDDPGLIVPKRVIRSSAQAKGIIMGELNSKYDRKEKKAI